MITSGGVIVGLVEREGTSDGVDVGDVVGPEGADDVDGLDESDGKALSEGLSLG